MPHGYEWENSAEKIGRVKGAALIAGPLLFILFLSFMDLDPGNPVVTRTAAVALLMAVWWITEAVPLAVTSLLPVVMFPSLGIMSGKAVAPIYFNHIIFLFIGGFLVALAMQRWSLHKRIALRVMLFFGFHPSSILFGFMVTTWFLSMWISNTAATMMMLPIALAVVMNLEECIGREKVGRYSIGVFLGVAYGASIGGVATLVGTPPNLSFIRILSINFPAVPDISFAKWFAFGFPISLGLLISVWLLLSLFFSANGEFKLDRGIFVDQYKALGVLSFEEIVVLLDFIFLVFLWLFRSDINLGVFTVPGWSGLFPDGALLNDGTVAIAMAILLFLIPARDGASSRIMDWNGISKLPWDLVLLFGGGFALASGFKESGLSMWLGEQFRGFGGLHPVLVIVVICLIVTFLTEFTSNTATTEMILPILAALAVAINVNPLFLMIPGTLSCSFAFMLPVATPPNAIVFGSQRLHITDMARMGVIVNLIGVVTTTVATYMLGWYIFGIDLASFPDWAAVK